LDTKWTKEFSLNTFLLSSVDAKNFKL